jgi:hypothetical protein
VFLEIMEQRFGLTGERPIQAQPIAAYRTRGLRGIVCARTALGNALHSFLASDSLRHGDRPTLAESVIQLDSRTFLAFILKSRFGVIFMSQQASQHASV